LKLANIKNAVFHTLRHTYASHCAMAGVDMLTLNKLLGHSNIQMTMRYAKLSPDYMSSAVRRVDTYWAPAHISSEVDNSGGSVKHLAKAR